MRFVAWLVVGVLALSGVGLASDTPSPEQLKKMYDEALVQLKGAQDRKNELAKETESLKAKTEELTKDIALMQSQMQDLKRDLADHAEKTYYLRAYHAAWQSFMKANPKLMASWKSFIESDGNAAAACPVLGNPDGSEGVDG